MIKAPEPEREYERLRALERLKLFETGPEERFDRLCRLASATLDVPVAYLSAIGRDRQWFKAACGLGDVKETSRESSMCSYTVSRGEMFHVPDTREHPIFCQNPFVLGEPHVRLYVGYPLRSSEGLVVGTFCLLGFEPRTLDPQEIEIFIDFARSAEAEMNRLDEVSLHRTLLRLRTQAIDTLKLEDSLLRMTANFTSALDISRTAIILKTDSQDQIISETPIDARPLPEFKLEELQAGSGPSPYSVFPSSPCVHWAACPFPTPNGPGHLLVERDEGSAFDTIECEIVHFFADQISDTLKGLDTANALVEAQKSAAIGSLASGIAHELNTPLGAIVLRLEGAIRKLNEPEVAQQRLQKAAQAASRAKVIIESLLSLAEQRPVHWQTLPPQEITMAGIETLQDRIDEAGVRLVTDLEDLPEIRTDEHLFEHLLRELIQNSLDALQGSETGAGEEPKLLEISLSGDPDHLSLQIRDNGVGIPEENLTRVFDPFFTTKPTGSGMGLGLSLCQNICKRLGGTIQVSSGARSTTIVVRLPSQNRSET